MTENEFNAKYTKLSLQAAAFKNELQSAGLNDHRKVRILLQAAENLRRFRALLLERINELS